MRFIKGFNATDNKRPEHAINQSNKEAAIEDRKRRAAVSDARRKKPAVTLPAVKTFDSTQD